MATQFEIDCALMAGRSYFDTRADINRFPVPDGWTEFFHVPNQTYPTASGFEAVSFQRGDEIVISYAGTGPGMNQDWWADFGLYTGFGSDQLTQAAEYYLQVKAANPDAHITLTGHSLGGGLAALVGVFFGETAVTFDQAPFEKSAELGPLHPDVAANLRDALAAKLDAYGERVYSDEALSGLTNFLQERETSDGIPNANLVRTIYVDGEVLSNWFPNSMIGEPTPPLTHGPTDVSATNLHAMALLTAFVENDQFRQVTFKLTDLLGMIYDSNLYYNDPNKLVNPERNFLEHLIRHQEGLDPTNPDDADYMLDRFTADLERIAVDGGLTMANSDLTKALTAFAMQMYYENLAAADPEALMELFSDDVTGGIHFDRTDIADTLANAKGYSMYFTNYLETIPASERICITALLPDILEWYIQAGGQAMIATAGAQSAFMLGGSGGDIMTGGGLTDVLVGNGGADQLYGIAEDGNDLNWRLAA